MTMAWHGQNPVPQMSHLNLEEKQPLIMRLPSTHKAKFMTWGNLKKTSRKAEEILEDSSASGSAHCWQSWLSQLLLSLASLSQSVQTATFVDQLAINTTREFQLQQTIDQKILVRL